VAIVLFVHGTGVREPAYSRTFRVVRDRLTALRPTWTVKKCYWAGEHGVKIDVPKTVPPGRKEGDGSTRSISNEVDDDELTMTVWQMLYGDPLFELRWMGNAAVAMSDDDEETAAPPGTASAGKALRQRLDALEPSSALDTALRESDLREAWDKALPIIRDDDELDTAFASNDADLPNALARALAAATIATAAEDGVPAPTAAARDAIVDAIVQQLGGGARGVKDWLLAPLKGIAARRITTYVTDNRAATSAEAAPAAGDVLLYQTRGDDIRQYIADRIAEVQEPVYVIAHSLGGIACVDLMITARPANVRGLITAGSQAPLLYELDCLTSLRPPAPLPKTFPRWLNIYDSRDFLSYLAEPVFDKHVVKDLEVKSGQPFPQSHSAYWGQDAVWNNVVTFVDEVERDFVAGDT
jgi:hypothetical protein